MANSRIIRAPWIVAVLLGIASLALEAQDTWIRTLDFGGAAGVLSAEPTPDGGEILAGTGTEPGIGGYAGAIITKLDASGQVTWAHGFSGLESAHLEFIRPTRDGGYIAFGGVEGPAPNIGIGLVLKLDSAGNVAWGKTFTAYYFFRFQGIVQAADGGYLASGTLHWDHSAPFQAAVFLKLNPNGSLAWVKDIGAPFEDITAGGTLIPTRDGGAILVANNAPDCSPCGEPWIVKVTPSGEIQWQKMVVGPLAGWPTGACELREGGYLVVGDSILEQNPYSSKAWMLRLSSEGQVLWSRRFANPLTRLWSIAQDPASPDCWVAGTIAPYDSPSEYGLWLSRVGQDGSVLWQGNFGGNINGLSEDVKPAGDGHLFLCAATGAAGLLVKTRADGTMDGSCPLPSAASAVDEDALLYLVPTSFPIFRPGVLDASLHPDVVPLSAILTPLCPCELSCAAEVTPASGTVPLPVDFRATAIVSPNCPGTAAYLWNFGDGSSSNEQSPAHIYATPGTYFWSLTVSLAGLTCSEAGTITTMPFDLNFYDDQGRSRLCANSMTGAWSWQVLRGSGAGTYSGTGSISWQNGVLHVRSLPGAPYSLSVKYYRGFAKAGGSFICPAKRLASLLSDANTRNNPPGC